MFDSNKIKHTSSIVKYTGVDACNFYSITISNLLKKYGLSPSDINDSSKVLIIAYKIWWNNDSHAMGSRIACIMICIQADIFLNVSHPTAKTGITFLDHKLTPYIYDDYNYYVPINSFCPGTDILNKMFGVVRTLNNRKKSIIEMMNIIRYLTSINYDYDVKTEDLQDMQVLLEKYSLKSYSNVSARIF